MKPGPFLILTLILAAACCGAQAAPTPSPAASASLAMPATENAAAAAAPAPSTTAGTAMAAAPAATGPAMPPPGDAATAAPTAPSAATPVPSAAATAGAATMASSSAGSLLQTILALLFVLALLVGLAWFMKRYGPKIAGNNAAMRVVSSLSLGGRERIVLIEVADQWIVVGASPGRINALATLPRQENDPAAGLIQQPGLAASNFAEWLKQTIEKRNGK